VRRMRITWDEVDGIMMRAVGRGLQRRTARVVRYIGIDEKSIRKRHKYFSVSRRELPVWSDHAAQEMRVGPSESAGRSRLQTTSSCWG